MRLRSAVITALALSLLGPAWPSFAAGTPAPDARKLVGMLAEPMHDPWRIPGDDGRDHLAYSLRLTNLMTIPIVVTAVSVRDQDGRRLQLLTGEALAPRLQELASSTPATQIAPTGSAVLTLDVPVRPVTDVDAVRTAVSYAPAPGAAVPPLIASLGLNWTAVSALEPLAPDALPVIAPPLVGPDWVNANQWGDPLTGHTGARMTKGPTLHLNEAFAIDFIRMREGTTNTGDGSTNDQYYAWGAPVLSSTDGTVITVVNDLPSIPPGAFPTDLTSVEQAGGNQVVVKAAEHVYLLYGHLQQGTVTVHVGDRVRVGQRLGLLGNSGNTTGAHLHFQVSDGPDVFDADSIPFVFTTFTRTGAIRLDAASNVSVVGPPRHFTHVYPTTLSVLRFAD